MKCVMGRKGNENIDIILTGDKDFLSLDMNYPRCMTVAQFLDAEGVNI